MTLSKVINSNQLSSLTQEFLFFLATTVFLQGSRFLLNLLSAKWIGPEQFGIWNALSPLLVYGTVFTFGVPNAMNREVPLLRGRGKNDEAQCIVNVAFSHMLVVSSISGFIIILASLLSRDHFNFPHLLMGFAFLFASNNMYIYFQALLKCNLQFREMSIQQLISGILSLALPLAITYYYGLNGFIYGQAIVNTIMCLLIFKTSSINFRWSLKLRSIVSLSQIGFPIMLVGLLYSILLTLDRWIILTRLGVLHLGYYTIAILTNSTVSLIPLTIGQQLYPRMAFEYGKTSSIKQLIPIIYRQTRMATAFTIPIIVGLFMILPYFTQHFLPQYTNGIKASRIILIGLFFLPFGGGVANFLNTINKQLYYLLIQFFAVIINLTFSIYLTACGFGLEGVALSNVVTNIFYVISLILVALYCINIDSKQISIVS